MESVLLVRYAEIHLKGLNRPYFERALMRAIAEALQPDKVTVKREQGRIFVFGVPADRLYIAADKLTRVFGIHSVSPTLSCEKDFQKIEEAASALMEKTLSDGQPKTFKVFARRADKSFPMRSSEICAELGHTLLVRFPLLKVDVHKPALSVGVEIRQERAFVFTEEIPCAGGMPVGCNGRAMLLISGGIDSPVAGNMIAKRGVSIDAVHFYSYPYTSERARDKVVELTKLMARYVGRVRLHLVPFTEIQLTIHEKCPSSETTILMRRLMMRIAERIALPLSCQALVTGEAIGQVASQTIESLTVTEDAVSLPVFRPLIGFDKEEIIEKAEKIGTFETSILPYEDCCTVFVPQHPVTKPNLERLRKSEALVDFEPMIEKAIQDTETVDVNPFDEDN